MRVRQRESRGTCACISLAVLGRLVRCGTNISLHPAKEEMFVGFQSVASLVLLIVIAAWARNTTDARMRLSVMSSRL